MSITLKAVEATIDEQGRLITKEPNAIKFPAKVLVTVAVTQEDDLAVASQEAWAKDWDNQAEDEAWASLQEEK